MINEIEEQQLTALREAVSTRVSGKRLSHTFAVEREIAVLAGIYSPENEYKLRASALLHDVTKQLSLEKQLQLCDEFGIIYTSEDKLMPKTFHAKTAVEIIKRDFPDFSDEYILTAVRYHTTGKADMTIGEKLLYLADYIEDTRTFEDCVKLREFFYSQLLNAVTETDKWALLNSTLVLSFDMTIRCLIDESAPIDHDTIAARNYLIGEQKIEQNKQ
ncbi:MAG: HD domain-containing protein [Clostridiales bacterium]|nr:HD domain-containing protein [Clostridiales bacterium]